MRLKNKVAIVTGAGAGIGRASALRFAFEGAAVIAVDVNIAGLEETVLKGNEIIGQHTRGDQRGSISAQFGDVSDLKSIEAIVSDTVVNHGQIDVVFSNAGIMREGSVLDLSENDWDALFSVNVKGAFLLGKSAIPHMQLSGGGSFIITASANSFYAESDIAGYCATKGAVMQLARAMAIDHGPDGIRVNCICPGWIETEMSKSFLEENPDGRLFAGRIAAAGRIGQPNDVAEVALFLASDESGFVTGSAYNVDGGWTAGMTKAVAII